MIPELAPHEGENFAAYLRRVRPDLSALEHDRALTGHEQALVMKGKAIRMYFEVYQDWLFKKTDDDERKRREGTLTPDEKFWLPYLSLEAILARRSTPASEVEALEAQTRRGFVDYLSGLDEGVVRAADHVAHLVREDGLDPLARMIGFTAGWIDRARLGGTSIPRPAVQCDTCANCGGPDAQFVEFAVANGFATFVIHFNAGPVCRICVEKAIREIGGSTGEEVSDGQ